MFKLGFAIMLICRVLCVCDMIREIGQNRTKKNYDYSRRLFFTDVNIFRRILTIFLSNCQR